MLEQDLKHGISIVADNAQAYSESLMRVMHARVYSPAFERLFTHQLGCVNYVAAAPGGKMRGAQLLLITRCCTTSPASDMRGAQLLFCCRPCPFGTRGADTLRTDALRVAGVCLVCY